MRRLLSLLVASAAVAAGTGTESPVPDFAAAGEQCSEQLDACNATASRLAARVAQLEAQLRKANEAAQDVVGTNAFYKHAFCAFLCVVMAALAAGLTMGLVSIEPMDLMIIVNTEDKDMVAEKDKIKLKDDQAAARRVLPLIRDHHRLLVTLLLMNSLANEALPLFLDRIVPSWLAVALSVTLVLMFGEIIPSAIFTGSGQLKIAATFAPLVACFRFLLTPAAWPIAKVLDYLLGEDHKGRYNFAELRAIVGIHANLRPEETAHMAIFKSVDSKQLGIITTAAPHHFSEETVLTFTDAPNHPAKSSKLEVGSKFYYPKPCEPIAGRDASCTFRLYSSERREPRDLITFASNELTSGAFLVQQRDEIKIMHGVMKLTHMCAQDSLRGLSEAAMLEQDEMLSCDLLTKILQTGYSRLPVYHENKHNVRGFILTKRLIVVSPEEGRRVADVGVEPLVLVPPDIPMFELLNKFQAKRCHIALVTSRPDLVKKAWAANTPIPPDVHMMGIITMEDVIEKLIQEDIWDEVDRDPDGRGVAGAGGWTPPALKNSPKRFAAMPKPATLLIPGAKPRNAAVAGAGASALQEPLLPTGP